jgi:hypothetical protein
MIYKIYNTIFNTKTILRVSDSAIIPFDENNRDYKEYLKWVEEGNTAEEYNPGGIE